MKNISELSQNEYLLQVGQKVAAARHAKGEKITSVATAVGYSSTVISQIENGRYQGLKLITLIELWEYLGIPLVELNLPLIPFS